MPLLAAILAIPVFCALLPTVIVGLRSHKREQLGGRGYDWWVFVLVAIGGFGVGVAIAGLTAGLTCVAMLRNLKFN